MEFNLGQITLLKKYLVLAESCSNLSQNRMVILAWSNHPTVENISLQSLTRYTLL